MANQSTTPHRDAAKRAILLLRIEVLDGTKQTINNIAAMRQKLAMAMSEACTTNALRQQFLSLAVGTASTVKLDEQDFSALWHYCMPFTDDNHHWRVNAKRAVEMRRVLRECNQGLWTDEDERESNAVFAVL